MQCKSAIPDSAHSRVSDVFRWLSTKFSLWLSTTIKRNVFPSRTSQTISQLDVIMLSFYPSQPIYTVYPGGYSPRRSSYSPYPSSTLPLADPAMRYRHALAEYLSAEEEYKALLRAREEARLRARVEAALRRQKLARLLQAEISRSRRVPELELALARHLSQAAPSEDHRSFRGMAPVTRQTSYRPLIDPLVTPYLHANGPRVDETRAEKGSSESLRDSCAVRASVGDKVCGVSNSFVHGPDSYDQAQPQHHAKANTSDNQPPCFGSKEVEHTVPNLEFLLRERLQKTVGDEEVQDVARAILRHLAPVSGVSCPPASAASTKVRHHSVPPLSSLSLTTHLQERACSMQPSDGADLYRSDALQGAAAEAAKESFKAHRADVAEREKSPPLSPSSKSAASALNVIQDIRSALTKLSSGFTFPSSLDFSDDEPDGLAYTPANAPVRVYQHALDNLLAQLDAVETDGDEDVRVVRRAAVKEVEKAIEDVERRVSGARERTKPGSGVGAAALAEKDLAEDKEQAIHVNASVDDNKPEADGQSTSLPKDCFGQVPSSPDVPLLQNAEVVLMHDATPANSEPKPDDGVLRDRSSSPVLETTSQTASVATPIVIPSDQGVASPIPTSDSQPQGSKYEAYGDQVITDQTTTCSEPSSCATPLGSPTTTILGAIAPSSTPVSHVLASHVSPEDLSTAFEQDQLSLLQGAEDEDDSISLDSGDEREWIEVEP